MSKGDAMKILAETLDLVADGRADLMTVDARTKSLYTKLLMDMDSELLDSYRDVFLKINFVRSLCSLSPVKVARSPILLPLERMIYGGEIDEEIPLIGG